MSLNVSFSLSLSLSLSFSPVRGSYTHLTYSTPPGGWFSESARSPQERKNRFNASASDEADEGEWFETALVYTFDFYSHVLDMQTMSAFGWDVVPILNGNPIVCMARLRTDIATGDVATEAGMQAEETEHLWKFEIWHERLLETAKQHDSAAE